MDHNPHNNVAILYHFHCLQLQHIKQTKPTAHQRYLKHKWT